MMRKKAAIELSANVILIVIISSVIVVSGLMLFFNLKGQAEKYTESIEQQTQEQLRALMLSDNSRVAIYPNELIIPRGKSKMTTVGVTNNLDTRQTFQSSNVRLWNVFYYSSPNSPEQIIQHNQAVDKYNFYKIFITTKSSGNQFINFGYINPGEQEYKNILVKVPKEWDKGQYIVTITIQNSSNVCQSTSGCTVYGLAKLYITVQ
ncbi:MAG: hypothetical protein KatS3mg002_0858 [Candidatus Woesearchaeota archaeon]|nr:MAG: hypothetical protein KatS3mg002_0858 [Candidatus Woesearchaeota archaeon]